MGRTTKMTIGAMALCLGLVSASLVACDVKVPDKKSKAKEVVVPEAFMEQRQLASAIDSLGDFRGTVVFPPEEGISVHGKKVIEGGVPAVLKFLKERKSGLNYIYKKYQTIKPGFEGSLSLDIIIDVCGDVVSTTEISSTTDLPEFNKEIMSSLAKQKFPKTDQGHYTLSFVLSFVSDAATVAVVDSTENDEDPVSLGGQRLMLPLEDSIKVQGNVAGGVPAIHAFLTKNGYGILHCYQKMLPRKEDAAGTIVLDVTVDPGGDVFNVFLVSSNTNFLAMDNEVKNYFTRLRFPPSVQGRYTVTFPLRFEKL